MAGTNNGPANPGGIHHGGHSTMPGTAFGGVDRVAQTYDTLPLPAIVPGVTPGGSRGENDPGMRCLGCHGKATITGGTPTTGYTMTFAASGLSTSTVAAA